MSETNSTQTARNANQGSRTVTIAPAVNDAEAGPSTQRSTVGVLKLRGGPARRQRVMWSDETVDNEGMGKKKSKICCIYHKPRAFDESSSESDSDSNHGHEPTKGHALKKNKKNEGPVVEDSSESEGGAGDGAARPRSKRKPHRHAHDCDHDTAGHKHAPNKYDAKTGKER